jgi:NADPH2:quinone reductase
LWINGASPAHASDATSKKGIFINLSRLLRQNGKLNLVLPYLIEDIPGHIEQSTTMAGSLGRDLSQGKIRGRVVKGRLGLGSGGKDFGFIFAKLIGRWLNEGKLKSDTDEFGRWRARWCGNRVEGSPKRKGFGGEVRG